MANNPQFSGLLPLQPPIVGSVSLPPMSFQFRPVIPAPHSQEFIPVASQNFQHVGRGVPLMNVRLPPPTHQPQFSQPMQQLPPLPGQPGHVFNELLERVREKEEKEAKRRKRLVDDFSHLLSSIKNITPSSKWEDCKPLLEGSQEYSSMGEESSCKEIFDNHVMQLKEQAKEKETKRKVEKARKEKERDERERRSKQRREKEMEYEREKEEHLKKDGDSEIAVVTDIHDFKEKRRSGRDDDKKHRKRHHSGEDHVYGNEYDRSKKSHGSSSDHKKSRQALVPESDTESRHKKHKRDHWNGSRRSGDHEELEDGEFGDVGGSR